MAEIRYIEACRAGAWHLEVWPKGRPQDRILVPYCCCSWRHEGRCRHAKGAIDFCRIRDGLNSRKDWSYIVLTFAQGEGADVWGQYRRGVFLWSKLRKRMVREFGPIKYIQTWERFKKGGCHVNLVVSNSALCLRIAGNKWREFRQKWLKPHAVACGFGYICWIESIRSAEAMAGYMGKLSRELTGTGKGYQVPVDAPPHFRRIRASRGVLPPIETSGQWSGAFARTPLPFDPETGELLQ